MRYGLLGEMEVRADDGTVVTIPAPKRRALLAALLLQADRPISADRLTEALWGAEPPPASVASLHAHVSRLRREIGSHHVITVPSGYMVSIGDGELDVRSFEECLATARRAAKDGRLTTASTAFDRALDLWRGPALAEFADRDFAQAAAMRLEELRSSAIEDRVDVELELGRHDKAIAELRSHISADPLRERPWRQLMLALYRSGRQADALSEFRRLRTVLVEELGIDPSPELQELEALILRQDPSLAGPTGGPSQPAIRLPLAITPFIGRRIELDQAVAILRSHRLLTLTGPGGVGKSRLGILVGHTLLDQYPDGTLFVDLSSVRDETLVLSKIGEVTGGGDRPADVIGDRRMLLLLDNFEQVIGAAADVAVLLERCPSLHVLVTSRMPLRLRAEHRLEVPPLAGSDAAALFKERGRAVLLATRFDDDVVNDIVARLDGLPLAIELAAARIGALSPPMLRDRLAERLALLSAGARDGPVRHRTLEATIAWSYELLDADAQSAFRRLSVLAGGFDLAAALAIAQADLDAISSLVDQSLLRRVGDRYAMLETIREFAGIQAAADGDTDAARDRHLEHFVAVASSTHRGTTEGGAMHRNAWISMCRTERENLHTAFEWAMVRRDDEAVLRLFRSIGMYWLFVGAMDEGTRWGEAALEAAGRLRADDRRMSALMTLSEFPRYSGDPDRALALKTEALALARSFGDRSATAVLLDDLASIHATTADFARARTLLAEALSIHDESPDGDPLDRAHTVITMAEVALLQRNGALAQQYVAEATALEAGADLFPDWIVESMCLQAKTLHALGRDQEAEPLFRAVVRDASDTGFQMPLVDALDALATICERTDPPSAARLSGMADRLRAEARLGVWDAAERDRTRASLVASIGDPSFRRLHAEGHGMSIPAIVDEVSRPD